MSDPVSTTTTGGLMCPDGRPHHLPGAALCPPRDADDEAYRRWVATSPWPEVVFSAAGAR